MAWWKSLWNRWIAYATTREVLDDHTLKDWHWPYQRTNSSGIREYACPHGIGHGGTHGCDGCCSHPSYKNRIEIFYPTDSD